MLGIEEEVIQIYPYYAGGGTALTLGTNKVTKR